MHKKGFLSPSTAFRGLHSEHDSSCNVPDEAQVAEAEAVADTLAFQPGLWTKFGHLVHMAAHTFVQIGRYAVSVRGCSRDANHGGTKSKDARSD